MTPEPDRPLRNPPTQARSRERLRRVLDAADEVLTNEGAEAFSTTRVAEVAEIPVGSVYRFFDDKAVRTALRRLPAAETHHSYAGGLLEHTVGVTTLCRETAQLHPRMRTDLLLAGSMG